MLQFGLLKRHHILPNRHLIVGLNKPLIRVIGGYDIIHVSGSSTNYIGDTDTYTLPDSDDYRTYSGWVNDVDHTLYTSTGVPKVITGLTLKNFGSGPTFFAGSRGVLVYSEAQTGEHAAHIIEYLKIIINTIYLVDGDGSFLVSNGDNLTIGA